jgi:hypothetical protein
MLANQNLEYRLCYNAVVGWKLPTMPTGELPMTDDLDIPEFLKRWPAAPPQAAVPKTRRRAAMRTIPYPRGGYARLLRQNRRPDNISEATWQACRDSIADRANRMARLRELRGWK